jgi:hypothetical protein
MTACHIHDKLDDYLQRYYKNGLFDEYVLSYSMCLAQGRDNCVLANSDHSIFVSAIECGSSWQICYGDFNNQTHYMPHKYDNPAKKMFLLFLDILISELEVKEYGSRKITQIG